LKGHARARRPGERALRRARAGLVVATALAGGLIVTQLPVGELLGQRAQLRTLGAQLTVLAQRNAALRAENDALRQPATVAAIAHQYYGLIRPGQRAYVILPDAGDGNPSSLGTPSLSRSQIVSSSAAAITGVGSPAVSGASAAGGAPGGSLLSRTLDHLEFWRWAF
jgi:cell division protein FtsB